MAMENKFCFLKGVVDCHSGVIQNCNNMRVEKCPLEEKKQRKQAGETGAEKGQDHANEPGKPSFCFLKGLVDCHPGVIQNCNNMRVEKCPLEEEEQREQAEEAGAEKKQDHANEPGKPSFCFLKGLVDCHPGVIQNCNNMRVERCPLEEDKQEKIQEETSGKQSFCFLKGLVDCSEGCVQDCNNKRVTTCPKK